jgi:hypothetical protein
MTTAPPPELEKLFAVLDRQTKSQRRFRFYYACFIFYFAGYTAISALNLWATERSVYLFAIGVGITCCTMEVFLLRRTHRQLQKLRYLRQSWLACWGAVENGKHSAFECYSDQVDAIIRDL